MLFTTIGSTVHSSNYFNKMERMSNDKRLTFQIRLMYRDLIELRNNNWKVNTEQTQNDGNDDAPTFIIRLMGSPYSLETLATYLDLFSEVVSGNIERGLVNLSEIYGWMEYECSTRTLHIKDPNPPATATSDYVHGVSASKKFMAIIYFFNYISDNESWNLCPNDDYLAMPEVLTFFRASEDLCAQFHAFFPYFKGEFINNDPMEIWITYIHSGVRKTHWAMLLEASRKEGKRCHICSCLLPWAMTVNDIGSEYCECTVYRTDLLERTTSNPYFDDDNRWQRDRDQEDEQKLKTYPSLRFEY
mmetsp:Transcript_42730/g.43281  ORF Transcript_42730/g.43281 Transcript_42730/m.43281 type:complete len:302 (+) Transcript_42730:542-1447(+)